jgi:N-acetylmuramoyl-L-alanine amidase
MIVRLAGASVAIIVAAVVGLVVTLYRADPPTPVDRTEAVGTADETPEPPAAEPRQLEVSGLPLPLTDGSCRWMPPTEGSQDLTVFLDPGHGGYDPGGEGETSDGRQITESAVALAVVEQAADQLRADGYAVVMSRTDDANVLDFPSDYLNGSLLTAEAVRADVRARAACANAADADVLVSLHFNSFHDSSVGGTETLYEPDRAFGRRSALLSTAVHQEIVTSLAAKGWTVPDRGRHPDHDRDDPGTTAEGAAYGHLLMIGPRKAGYNENPSQMPGVVVEAMFLTRPTEADIAASERGQRVLATAIATGVDRYLSTGR